MHAECTRDWPASPVDRASSAMTCGRLVQVVTYSATRGPVVGRDLAPLTRIEPAFDSGCSPNLGDHRRHARCRARLLVVAGGARRRLYHRDPAARAVHTLTRCGALPAVPAPRAQRSDRTLLRRRARPFDVHVPGYSPVAPQPSIRPAQDPGHRAAWRLSAPASRVSQ